MSDELLLRARIVGVLNSKACNDIAFVAAGISILGYHYGYLCDLICQHCVGVKYGVTAGAGAAAEYNHDTDTLSFANRDLGFYKTPSGRAQIVHECTHAVIDVVRKGMTVRRADNEAIAWVAQTIFSLLSGDRIIEDGDFFGSLAAVARQAIANRDKRPFEVPAQAMSFIGDILHQKDAARAKKAGLVLPEIETMNGIRWPRPEPMAPD